MANTVLQFRTGVAGRVPTTAQLPLGQVAFNYVDGLLFFKKNVAGTETVVTVGGAGYSLLVSNNLSDISNAATARTNLGLGTMATQAASGVAITGGTAAGVTRTGGTLDGCPVGATTADSGRFTTLALTGSQAASAVLAAPNGAAGAPSFRQLANTDVSGFGTLSTQNANAVAVTGGAIDGTPVGATTAAALRGTTLALTAAQAASTVLAAPAAGGAPAFRRLAASDLDGVLGQKSVTVPSPTASEKIPLFFTRVALTAVEIRSLVLGSGSPSVTFSVRHGADLSGAGTEIVSGGTACANSATGLSTTAFNAASVAAGSWLWLTTSAVSGTIDQLHVTICF